MTLFSELQRGLQPPLSCPPFFRSLAVFPDPKSRQTIALCWGIHVSFGWSAGTCCSVITYKTCLGDHFHMWHCEIPGCGDEKEDARRLATLTMRVGGLGLRSATRMAPSAFGASWADVLPMVHERLPTVAHGALEGEDALQSCLGELKLAAHSLDRHGFISRPQWRALQSGARPPRANDIELGEWAHGWQHYATSASEHHSRETVVLAHSCPSHQAHLRSHSWQRVFARVLQLPHPTRVSRQSRSFLRVDLGTVASAIPCDRSPMRVRRRLGLQGAPQGCMLAFREIAHTRQGVQGSRSIGALQCEACRHEHHGRCKRRKSHRSCSIGSPSPCRSPTGSRHHFALFLECYWVAP